MVPQHTTPQPVYRDADDVVQSNEALFQELQRLRVPLERQRALFDAIQERRIAVLHDIDDNLWKVWSETLDIVPLAAYVQEDMDILGRLLSLAALPTGLLTDEARTWYADEIERGVPYCVVESADAWTLYLEQTAALVWRKPIGQELG